MAQVSTRATVRVTIIKFDRTLQLIVIKYMLVNLNIDCRMSLQSNLILNVKNYFGLFVTTGTMYRTHAIITRGLYTFFPLFEVHLCTVTFGLMYGQYSRAVSNQEWVILVASVR